jgi:hypothetical protein
MFTASRGCVYCVRRGGSSAFAIGGLAIGGCPPILVTSINPTKADLVLPSTSMAKKKRLFVFGEAMSPVQISGVCMLGPLAQGDSLRRVNEFFEANRVSKSMRAVNLSSPAGGARAYLTDFSVGAVDPEFNLVPFSISGTLAT